MKITDNAEREFLLRVVYMDSILSSHGIDNAIWKVKNRHRTGY